MVRLYNSTRSFNEKLIFFWFLIQFQYNEKVSFWNVLKFKSSFYSLRLKSNQRFASYWVRYARCPFLLIVRQTNTTLTGGWKHAKNGISQNGLSGCAQKQCPRVLWQAVALQRFKRGWIWSARWIKLSQLQTSESHVNLFNQKQFSIRVA